MVFLTVGLAGGLAGGLAAPLAVLAAAAASLPCNSHVKTDGCRIEAAARLVRSRLDRFRHFRHFSHFSNFTFGVRLFNRKAGAVVDDDGARLPGEPAAGITGIHCHPVAQRTARPTLSHRF